MRIAPLWIITIAFASAISACGSSMTSTTSAPAGEAFAPGLKAPTGNLIKNSGFESGLVDWEDWGSSQLQRGNAHSGQNSVRIRGQGGLGQEVIYRVKTRARYLLTAQARVGTYGESATIGVRFFDMNNRTISETKKTVSVTTWQSITLTFFIPERVSSAKIFVWKDSLTNAPADFDEFSLTMISPPTDPPSQPALPNPLNLKPLGPSGDWNLVLNENFSGTRLNNTVWNNGFWFNSTLNRELQAYRPENVTLNGGVLNLVAEKRSTQTTWNTPMDYASGAITTRGKFSFTFGVAEARVRVPKGRGFWPAFWLLPEGKRAPPEIDILEIFGHDTSTVHFNYHFFDANGVHTSLPGIHSGPDFSTGFHVFTVEWTSSYVKYYVDGIERHSYTGDFILRDPAFVILNLAVGGTWPGNPDASTLFPQSYQVDYVRVWQR